MFPEAEMSQLRFSVGITANTLVSGQKRGFSKKTLQCLWLCVGNTLLLYRLRTWSKCHKTRQVF